MDLSEFSGKGDINLHLSNVAQYLTAPEDVYTPPPIPVKIPDFQDIAKQRDHKFGAEWKKYFHLTEEFTFLNHGALGCSLKESLDVAHSYERYVDSQPLRAIDRENMPLLCHVKREMAKYIKCDPTDIFLIENCSAGIITILRSLDFTPADTILTLSLGYGAVGFAVDRLCEKSGAKHHKVQIDLPVKSSQEIVDKVKGSLFNGIKLAIFDHIPSNTSFILPIEELISICKQRGMMVLIDGAHSLGQLDIDVPSYGADFYVTNCHKWFCNTRGSAVTYVRKELQPEIKPLVVSWGYNRGFVAEFAWSGTQYYSQYISLLSTINFWNVVGAEAIRTYCTNTVKQAAKLCCEAWKVEPVCPEDMIGMMALVRLPDVLNDPDWKPDGVKKDIVVDCLYFVHKIEVPVRNAEGGLYVRLSCHIYNQLSDFEKLSSAVLQICEDRDSLVNYNSKFNPIPSTVPW